jgi:four helix bundle protein
MLIKTFREIIAWQKAHELTLGIYEITETFPKSEIFGLTSQIRRSSVSIPANIAEGFKRKTKNDSLHFYNIAEGSLEELKYELLLSRDLKYINEQRYGELSSLADEVGKLIHGWMKIQK